MRDTIFYWNRWLGSIRGNEMDRASVDFDIYRGVP